jgi:hypothetical protein
VPYVHGGIRPLAPAGWPNELARSAFAAHKPAFDTGLAHSLARATAPLSLYKSRNWFCNDIDEVNAKVA